MPTSSFDKEFIIEDPERFIEAVEKAEEWARNNPHKRTNIRVKELTRRQIRRMLGKATLWDRIRGWFGR